MLPAIFGWPGMAIFENFHRRGLVRARHEWPSGRRAAEQRDELASP